jgi:hypothetical protein
MLLYHPFLDAYHCCFRMLRLLEKVGNVQVEVERFRIWDFYLLFPTALQFVELPRASMRVRSIAKKLENRYEVLPDSRRAFIRLEPIQNAALAHLSSWQLIDSEQLGGGKIVRTDLQIPAELSAIIQERNSAATEILEFLVTTFLVIPLYGKGGLRLRTDLFDNRYDIS